MKNRVEEAESKYLEATSSKPSDPQAWQGLVKLYQRQSGKNLQQYQHAALKLAEIYRDADEMYKCQDVVDRFIDHVRTHGEPRQLVEALDLVLPGSPIYPALEGRVPPPALTYQTQAQMVESEESKRINTLIGERRTRIGARIQDVTLEVKREVYRASRLGSIYGEVINWTADDGVRRMYEEKLLQYCHERLLAWPAGEQKQHELGLVQKLSNDMVIIKHPFKLAWDIALDWKDYREVREWDVNILQEYCAFFPDSDLQRVLSGFLTSAISPFPGKKEAVPQEAASRRNTHADEQSEDEEEGGGAATSYVPLTDEDRLLVMTEGIASADSVLAYRLMGEYYQHLEEHESNAELMRKALEHLESERLKSGLGFANTRDFFHLCLGTALVFYQSPRHHAEARRLFEQVLEHEASSTSALIGVGLIYEEEEDYEEAIDFLSRALARDPSDLRVRSEAAWVKALKGDWKTSKEELDACVPLMAAKGQSFKALLAQTQWRLGSCLWNLDTSQAARKSRSGAYQLFLEALKNDLNLAPAYTSLGVYYADYAKDKTRARKCFMKAIEISPSEVISAEKLAKSFADDGDWDKVELVARRVVDSGKVKPPPGSRRKGISWPFAALGVAELNKQAFQQAIVSFQAALRISPQDYDAWVGLGESYYNSGRLVAATKAILNAQRLEQEGTIRVAADTWFTTFMLANIKRELGDFEDSIALYRDVIKGHPEEEGVAIALMQTMVESALDSADKGFLGKSVQLAVEVLTFATEGPTGLRATFNFWKTVGDACSVFSTVQGWTADFPTGQVGQLLGGDENAPEYQVMRDMDRVGIGIIQARGLFADDEQVGVDLTRCLQATILAHKRALHASANDTYAQAVAYYNLGWAEYRAHTCLPTKLKTKPSRYLRASVQCFKRAIELEAGNADFWNSLGVVTSEVNPAVSQHSFVRSIFLDERSAHAWTNLGTLALLQTDLKLANEAFARAQSTDPDYAQAWLGQGLVALLLGNTNEARGLFTHAMGMAEVSAAASRKLYTVSVFDHILSSPPDMPVFQLMQSLFALAQLGALRPQALACTHLSALMLERSGDSARAVERLESICDQVEADFEATESPEALRQFALAKADLARSCLAAGLYEKAIEAGALAIQLSSDDSDHELSAEERKKARLGAHLAVGLAQYYSQDVREAIACFDAALEESDRNPDAACILAQVLWATGENEAKDRAREVLYGTIGEAPDHVQSVLLLGVIALLDGDEESLDAVVTELESSRAKVDRVSQAEYSQIGEVLRAIAVFGGQNGSDEAVRVQGQTDVMLHPHLPHGWSELAGLASSNDAEEEGEAASEMALRVARKGVPPRGDVAAEDLASAYAGAMRVADAQTAIMIAPWEGMGWRALHTGVCG